MKKLLSISLLLAVALSACKKDKQAVVSATITTTVPTNITSNSVQTGGNITSNGGSAISKSGICWATHSTPTLSDSITDNGISSGSFTTSLTNLAAYTTYYIRAYAINATGTTFGDEVSFVTLKGFASLTTTAITGIAPLTAQSGGNIISDGGYSIIARGICWSTSTHPTIANFRTSDGAGTGSFTDSLTLLASQTSYYVRAYATTSFGTAYGNEIAFTSSSADAITDIDGNVYAYIQIGTQTWLTANLKTTRYQNGDPITNGLTNFDWPTTNTGAYTFPNGDSANNNTYGKYYNPTAIIDSRGICPSGWHVPTDVEWQTLEFYEGMTVSDTGSNNMNFRGTIGAKFLAGGSSGLNLQLAGYLCPGCGDYSQFDQVGLYGTSTVASPAGGIGPIPVTWERGFNLLAPDPGPIYRSFGSYAQSVRCIKD